MKKRITIEVEVSGHEDFDEEQVENFLAFEYASLAKFVYIYHISPISIAVGHISQKHAVLTIFLIRLFQFFF